MPEGTTRLSPETHGLWWVAEVVTRHKRVMTLLVVVGLVVSVLIAVLTPPVYRASVVIAPASVFSAAPQAGLASGLLGAAQRLGVAGGAGSDPSAMFPAFLRSEYVSRRLLLRQYGESGTPPSTLLDMLLSPGDSSAVRLAHGRRLLIRDVLKSSYSNKSGLTTVSIYLPNAQVAADVANQAARILDSAYTDARLKQAVAWAEYLEVQCSSARKELESAEGALAEFHQSNRITSASPLIGMEEARLQRRVDLGQQVYVSVMAQLALARADANKEVPSIAVVDPAVAPLHRTRPERARIVLTGLFISAILGIVACLAIERAKSFSTSEVAGALGMGKGAPRAG